MSAPDPGTNESEFRAYARDWLARNAPPPPPERLPITPIEVMTIGQRDYLQAWQQKCYQAGLVGTDFPKEYGGHGHRGMQRIANQELERSDVPFLINIVGLTMAAPTILKHGTEAQKRQFLPGCLSGAEIWCQGFSEPGAGSDLANQRTWAERDGDDWVVNGHKVWTSLGHFARWMILLARTSKSDKYNGLSYFICPVEGHPGVSVRPLVKITGETGFNEVLFEDVRIPDAYRLDEVGKGWAVAMTTLTSERGASEGAGSGGIGAGLDAIPKLIELARNYRTNGVRAADDPIFRDAIVQRAIVAEGLKQGARRAGVPALCDHPLRLPLQAKLAFSEFDQANARLGVQIAGAHSTLYKLDPRAPDAGHWPLAYLNSYGNTIAAGTNEIQRNILGERVLGLPKSK